VTRRLAPVAVAVAALAAPPAALAHGGKNAVAAVNHRARILAVRPPTAAFEARIMDGDQGLWLHVRQKTTLTVLGILGEPMLRFDGHSFLVNDRSPTAQIAGLVSSSRQSDYSRGARPVWRTVSLGSSISWNDHRVHAAAVLAKSGPARRIAGWRIPLRVGGAPEAIVGELSYVPPPPLWPWIVLIPIPILLAAAALKWSRGPFARLAALGLPALTAVAFVLARAGRDLYGRPDIGLVQVAALALAAAFGLVALYLLVKARSEVRTLAAFAVGVAGIYKGVDLLPVLGHGLVLAGIPAALERAAVALSLGGGAATCLLYAFVELERRKSAPALTAPSA
jgi:hypothetical protein